MNCAVVAGSDGVRRSVIVKLGLPCRDSQYGCHGEVTVVLLQDVQIYLLLTNEEGRFWFSPSIELFLLPSHETV